MPFEMDFGLDTGTLVGTAGVLLGLLIVYYVLLVRALVEMIRVNAPSVITLFTYISLIPLPPLLILGVLNLIIWRMVRNDLMAERGSDA